MVAAVTWHRSRPSLRGRGAAFALKVAARGRSAPERAAGSGAQPRVCSAGITGECGTGGGDQTMKDTAFTLHFDSPMFLGGCDSGGLEPQGRLRGTSIRGLLHTWARALIGPFFDGDGERTRKAEQLLLGSTEGATLRLDTRRDAQLRPIEPEEYLLPHKGKGRRPAFDVWQETVVRLLPRPNVASNDGLDEALVKALAAVAWTAFSFGALGKRCRRGMGSLTVTGIEGPGSDLPAFPGLPSRTDVEGQLARGLGMAQDRVGALLQADHARQVVDAVRRENPPPQPAPDLAHPYAATRAFFQLAGAADIYVSKHYPSGRSGVCELMNACSRAKSADEEAFGDSMGSMRPRFASPLWIRVYQLAPKQGATSRAGRETSAGAVLVATFSPHVKDRQAVEQVLNAIGAKPLATVAGGTTP